jgi:hypothetical protein
VRPPIWVNSIVSPRAVLAPATLPQRLWKSQFLGSWLFSASTSTAFATIEASALRIARASAADRPFAQDVLHCGLAGEEPERELVGLREVQQRVETELAQWRLVTRVLAEPDTAQSAGIRHDQLATVVEVQMDLRESGRPIPVVENSRLEFDRLDVGDAEGTGHPEVEQRVGSLVELEPELLPAPVDGLNAATFQLPLHGGRRDAVKDDAVLGTADLFDPPPARH